MAGRNARTGEVQGEWPRSWVKIALLVLLALIVVGAIWFLVRSQGGGGTSVEWSSLAPGGRDTKRVFSCGLLVAFMAISGTL